MVRGRCIATGRRRWIRCTGRDAEAFEACEYVGAGESADHNVGLLVDRRQHKEAMSDSDVKAAFGVWQAVKGS